MNIQAMVKEELEMTLKGNAELLATCKHDGGFSFRSSLLCDDPMAREYIAVFTCNRNCSFFLNFHPLHYPNGVAYITQKEADAKEGKYTPELVSSKRG